MNLISGRGRVVHSIGGDAKEHRVRILAVAAQDLHDMLLTGRDRGRTAVPSVYTNINVRMTSSVS
jgi:hypothetical protein